MTLPEAGISMVTMGARRAIRAVLCVARRFGGAGAGLRVGALVDSGFGLTVVFGVLTAIGVGSFQAGSFQY